MRDLMFLSSWLVFIPLALQAGAHVGVLLWAWTSVLAPNDVLYGIAKEFPFAKIAAVLTILLLITGRGGRARFRLGLPELLFVGLAISSLVSQATSPAESSTLGWELCQKFLKILMFALVILAVINDRMRMHALILAVCLGLGFTGVAEGMKFLISGSAHKVLGSPSLGDNNQLALNILLILPLLQHLHAVLRNPVVRLVVLISGLLCVVCVIASYSRGAFSGLVLLAVSSVLAGKRKLTGLAVLAGAAVVGSQFVGSDWTARMNTIETADSDDSFLGRVAGWKVSTLVALSRPFGSGFHGIQQPDIWWRYAPGENSLPIFPPTDPAGMMHAAHSIYFEVLGDLGFPGLALFLILLLTSWVTAGRTRRSIRRACRADLDWARDLSTRLQIALTVFMVSGGLLSAVYYDIEYVIIALIVVVHRHADAALRTVTPVSHAAIEASQPQPRSYATGARLARFR
jgi:putative inorganic carbon (hco3(-)) transporter